MRTLRLALTVSFALLAGCAAPRPPSGPGIAIPRDEAEFALAVMVAVYDETGGNAFAASRQAKRQHLKFYGSNPELYRRIDDLAVLSWVLEGGEEADARCYMRGFAFGSAHHAQCVYEFKMSEGEEREAAAPRAPRQPTVNSAPAAPPVVTREQGGKVYGADECIGP